MSEIRATGDESSHEVLDTKGLKPHTDPEYYYRLRQRGKTHAVAAKMAGYSPKTQERYIMQHKKIKAIVSSVDEMRKINQRRPGHTFLDDAETLVEIRDDESVNPTIRRQCAMDHSKLHGYEAPKEIKSSNLHLHAELEDLEEDDLKYMAEYDINGNEIDPDREDVDYEEI